MHIHCPACSSAVSADGINLELVIAKCVACNNIFDFTAQLEAAPLPVPLEPVPDIMPPPSGLEVIQWPDALEMNVNWRKSGRMFLFTFAIFWNVFVAFFVLVFVVGGEPILMMLPMLLFMLPFVGIGIYMLYASLGYVFNTTNIFIDQKYLAVEHRPFNFLAQKPHYLDSAKVQQLFVVEYEQGKTNNVPVLAYKIQLRQKDGDTFTILDGIRSVSYARYIERLIEEYLGLENIRMPGEHR